jgi:hypothetical protein
MTIGDKMDRTRPTAVYRIYDNADVLLYVGISFTPKTRWRSHTSATWWPRVHRHTVEWYPDRPTARAVELAVIHADQPVGNIAETPRNDTKPHIARAAWQKYAAVRRSEREQLLMVEFVAGATVREIARRSRLSHEGVRKMLKRHGIEA